MLTNGTKTGFRTDTSLEPSPEEATVLQRPEYIHLRRIHCRVVSMLSSMEHPNFLSDNIAFESLMQPSMDLPLDLTIDSKKRRCSEDVTLSSSGAKNTKIFESSPAFSTGAKIVTDLNKKQTSSEIVFPSRRPMRCEICSKVVRADNYQVHMRNHTGEKPYSCPLCAFRSANPSSMPKHLRLHQRGRPVYKCRMCPYSSLYKINMSSHIRKLHGTKYKRHSKTSGPLPLPVPRYETIQTQINTSQASLDGIMLNSLRAKTPQTRNMA